MSPRRRRLVGRILWWLLLLGALFGAGNALLFLLADGHGAASINARFRAAPVPAWCHAGGGALAILIGPFQFLDRLRGWWPGLHRFLGRVYLLAVAASATGGLYFMPASEIGWASGSAFGLLAVFWLATGTAALVTIRAGRVQAHRRWMLRNYALTYSATSLRLLLGLFMAAGLAFPSAYVLAAWLCWLLNWMVVEIWIQTSPRLRKADPGSVSSPPAPVGDSAGA
ncbi:MAG: DUF2306 domain-containing protein [Puniceicoccaceae bacterium]|nr:MAG: DUF2306 domain-containing protein [Puniceicoccaceae bacterium]